MKAAFVENHGPAESLQVAELPEPHPPAAEQLLVEVVCAAVNPIDTYIRSGAVGGEIRPPWIPGCDFAGRVLQPGSAVTDFKEGDRVWGSNQSLAGRQGTLAERISVDQEFVYPIPDAVSFESAAAGALTGITAHLGLHLHGQLQAGETVFVNGGTGGVGSAVIQLAKQADAKVLTTVGSDDKAEVARSLGADIAINYKDQDVVSSLNDLNSEGGIDLWFETLRTPSPQTMIPLMNRRGRMIVMAGRNAEPILPVGPLYVNDLRICGFAMFNATPQEQRVAADEINTAAASGNHRTIIGQQFNLDQAGAAHRLQEDNTINGAGTLTGKIVVNICSP